MFITFLALTCLMLSGCIWSCQNERKDTFMCWNCKFCSFLE